MKGNYKPYTTQDDILTVNKFSVKQSPVLNGKTPIGEESNTSGRRAFMNNASCLADLRKVDDKCLRRDSNVSCSEEQQIRHHHQMGSSSGDAITKTTETTTGQVRHYMALLGLSIAVVNLYAQNTFFIAIVEMVLPPEQMTRHSSPSPQPFSPFSTPIILSNTTMATTSDQSAVSQWSSAEPDQSCPIEFRYRHYYDSWRFPETSSANQEPSTSIEASKNKNQLQSAINVEDRFNWDAGMQGVLLGACAVGTAPLQILSGRLAEIYGPKWVLMSAGLGTALTNLLVPALARYSFNLLVVNRILMGVSQAGLEPAIVCLMASWLTPSERGFFLSLLLFAICFGSFVGMLVTTMILSLGYHWATTFYVAGYLNLIVSILWLLFSSDRPSDSKLLSSGELSYIIGRQSGAAHHQAAAPTEQPADDKRYSISEADEPTRTRMSSTSRTRGAGSQQEAPWGRILSSRAVWAFIICKVSNRWCADVVASELPTYLANVQHLSIKLNGIVNSVSAGLFAVFSLLTGYLVNEISRSRERALKENRQPPVSLTNLRKIFQALGSFGSTLNLVLMVRYDCDLLLCIVMLLVLSCALVLGAGGELQIPYDMTSKYPGTLHGIACTLAVSGWLAPPTIGLILSDEPTSRYRWSIVWHLTAAINFIGGLVFVLFADASARDFDLDSSSGSGSSILQQPHHRQQEESRRYSSSSSSSSSAASGRAASQIFASELPASQAAAADYKKKEPAAVARPESAACYVNVVCELAGEQTGGREPNKTLLVQQQQQQQSTTTLQLSRSHYEAEAGGGAAAAIASGREILLQDLSKVGGQRQPDEPLFQKMQMGSCGRQVTRAPRANWWLRNSPAWRLWAKLAGRQQEFSVPPLTGS